MIVLHELPPPAPQLEIVVQVVRQFASAPPETPLADEDAAPLDRAAAALAERLREVLAPWAGFLNTVLDGARTSQPAQPPASDIPKLPPPPAREPETAPDAAARTDAPSRRDPLAAATPAAIAALAVSRARQRQREEGQRAWQAKRSAERPE